jgi:hypothetical protein
MVVERDWVGIVAEGRCDDCGLSASALRRDAIPEEFRREAVLWSAVLLVTPDASLRHRPGPERWSALELSAHVRDVLAIFAERIELALVEQDPEFGWWDHEAAVIDERYNQQRPQAIADAIVANAERLAGTISGLDKLSWLRTGTRRCREMFTVEGLARFALHESVHHRQDAERACSRAGGGRHGRS